MASGQWWNIWTLASAQAEEIVPHTIQSATRPVQGGQSKWGQIFTVAGPYATQADALKAIGKFHGPPPHSTGPGGAPTGVLTGLAAIGDFFSRLTQANTWIRVAEVVLGLGLIVVGLAHLASGTAAGRAALKAGKAAAIL